MNKQKGYTLVELLIGIIILFAVLGGVVVIVSGGVTLTGVLKVLGCIALILIILRLL